MEPSSATAAQTAPIRLAMLHIQPTEGVTMASWPCIGQSRKESMSGWTKAWMTSVGAMPCGPKSCWNRWLLTRTPPWPVRWNSVAVRIQVTRCWGGSTLQNTKAPPAGAVRGLFKQLSSSMKQSPETTFQDTILEEFCSGGRGIGMAVLEFLPSSAIAPRLFLFMYHVVLPSSSGRAATKQSSASNAQRRPTPMQHWTFCRGPQGRLCSWLAGRAERLAANSASPAAGPPRRQKQRTGSPYKTARVDNHTRGLMKCIHLMLTTVATKMSAVRKSTMLFSDPNEIQARPASKEAPRETCHGRGFAARVQPSLVRQTANRTASKHMKNATLPCHVADMSPRASRKPALGSRGTTPNLE
mmetsp:Transcript_84059/g.271740  ORF Transcript_84059/g.271740 Transcript_84059/m.271740 type:complete len:356 (-) Transcript_84059:1436-2503(-)